jgi:hypothetical protein
MQGNIARLAVAKGSHSGSLNFESTADCCGEAGETSPTEVEYAGLTIPVKICMTRGMRCGWKEAEFSTCIEVESVLKLASILSMRAEKHQNARASSCMMYNMGAARSDIPCNPDSRPSPLAQPENARMCRSPNKHDDGVLNVTLPSRPNNAAA